MTPIQIRVAGWFLAEYRKLYSEECTLTLEDILDLASMFEIMDPKRSTPSRIETMLTTMHDQQHEDD